MESAYLETTFISYLVSLPARDLVISAHQAITRNWWDFQRERFTCVISQVVVDEISVGDPFEVEKRLSIVQSLSVLTASEDAESLTSRLIATGIFPLRAARDAAQIAIASVHGIEYLLTWNCRHLANAQIVRRVRAICENQGFAMPQICTPEELLEAPEHD